MLDLQQNITNKLVTSKLTFATFHFGNEKGTGAKMPPDNFFWDHYRG